MVRTLRNSAAPAGPALLLTLIATDRLPPIADDLVSAIIAGIEEAGGHVGDITWIEPGRAVDIPVQGLPKDSHLRPVVTEKLGDAQVDAVIQSNPRRDVKLLISDMDSTIIQEESLDELAAQFDLKDEIAAITEKAMRGEMDFAEALRTRVAMLKGAPEQALLAVDERLTYMPGARRMVRGFRDAGVRCLLVSGGFTHFTTGVAQQLGFHDSWGNRLIIDHGFLTGEVGDPIRGGDEKRIVLMEQCFENDIDPDETLAVGDGANDIPMLEAAGLGIAFHAKPAVVYAAPAAIVHSDLTALLYIAGLTIPPK
ncbi:MAG: phosphoserine phosphatase SerB [Alphaproteobacteria bacterium]